MRARRALMPTPPRPTSPTALRPVKRIIRIALMAPDWAPAARPPPASLHDIAELMVRVAGPPAHYTTREFPADRASIDIGSYHADDRAFRAAAGWEPQVGLEEGIRQSLDWFRPRLGEYL